MSKRSQYTIKDRLEQISESIDLIISRCENVHSANEFYRFVRDFNVIEVKWSQPTNISASYFLRVLQGCYVP